MDISAKLADLNWQRRLKTPLLLKMRVLPFMLLMEMFIQADAYSIPIEKLEKLQDSLRILSGLYGLLKPLDLIQAYRLEMGTKLPVEEQKNLYEFWKRK
jgi:cytoplasmic iron level regulating protein YaaA (DUF328/UPF0246 family)